MRIESEPRNQRGYIVPRKLGTRTGAVMPIILIVILLVLLLGGGGAYYGRGAGWGTPHYGGGLLGLVLLVLLVLWLTGNLGSGAHVR